MAQLPSTQISSSQPQNGEATDPLFSQAARGGPGQSPGPGQSHGAGTAQAAGPDPALLTQQDYMTRRVLGRCLLQLPANAKPWVWVHEAKFGLAHGTHTSPTCASPHREWGAQHWLLQKPARAHVQGICLFMLIYSAHFPFSLPLPSFLVFSIFCLTLKKILKNNIWHS